MFIDTVEFFYVVISTLALDAACSERVLLLSLNKRSLSKYPSQQLVNVLHLRLNRGWRMVKVQEDGRGPGGNGGTCRTGAGVAAAAAPR